MKPWNAAFTPSPPIRTESATTQLPELQDAGGEDAPRPLAPAP
jgi:hypothetical protein